MIHTHKAVTSPVVQTLQAVLADSYALYLKTQNYHWNVEGPYFKTLHLLFEEQYTELAAAIDTLAELIRGLGEKVPGTFEHFIATTHLKAGVASASSTEMVSELIHDQSIIESTLTAALKESQAIQDEVVSGFLIERLTAHRKAAWMLRSSL